MTHTVDGQPGTPTPQDDGLGIPAFLRREPAIVPQQETVTMRNDDEGAAPAIEPEAPKAPAKPEAKVRATPKAPTKKAASGPAKGNGKHPAKAAAKAPAKAPVKAKGAAKAAAPKGAKAKAPKAERQRDPAKLDQFGFRKGSIKSQAAALYAKGKGATLAEVKDAVGSVQFNLLTELKNNGFKVETGEVKNDNGRMVTRYKLY